MKLKAKLVEKFRKLCGYNALVQKLDQLDTRLERTNIQLQRNAEALVAERAEQLGQVYIHDYPYHPKIRKSFTNSKIKDIIADAVNASGHIDEIIHSMYAYRDVFAGIPLHEEAPDEPYWMNVWIPLIDGMMIYTTLAQRNPRWYVEVGSGNTTKFAAKAIRDRGLRTEIISIDPCPRAEIDTLCHKVFRCPLEDMDMGFFSSLTEEDIFLVDNSHRAFPNSDVTVFFTEILPGLAPGLIYALHDITLPDEIFVERFYNEQYMLATYLLGGAAGDSIYFPTGYLINHTQKLKKLQQDLMLDSIPLSGGFFWMRKK